MQVKQQINVNFWEAHFTKILSWEVLPKKSPFRVELQEVCRISERLVRKDGPVIASRCGCLEMEVSFLVWRNSKYTVWTEEVRQEDRKTKFMPLGILEWLMWSTGREGVAPRKKISYSLFTYLCHPGNCLGEISDCGPCSLRKESPSKTLPRPSRFFAFLSVKNVRRWAMQ